MARAWGMWSGSCNTSYVLAFRLGESWLRGPAIVEILYALSEITGWKSEIKQFTLQTFVILSKDMYFPFN